jgi:hypothetical protein
VALSRKLLNNRRFYIEKEIISTICEYTKPVTITKAFVDNRKIIEVSGKHMILSDLSGQVENLIRSDKSIEEVRFVSAEIFFIDASLSRNDWHGTNIAVFVKRIKVVGVQKIDVSGDGFDGQDLGKAVTLRNGDGGEGEDGLAGESGGNVVVIAEAIMESEGLTVESSGEDWKGGFFL